MWRAAGMLVFVVGIHAWAGVAPQTCGINPSGVMECDFWAQYCQSNEVSVACGGMAQYCVAATRGAVACGGMATYCQSSPQGRVACGGMAQYCEHTEQDVACGGQAQYCEKSADQRLEACGFWAVPHRSVDSGLGQ